MRALPDCVKRNLSYKKCKADHRLPAVTRRRYLYSERTLGYNRTIITSAQYRDNAISKALFQLCLTSYLMRNAGVAFYAPIYGETFPCFADETPR